jgi:hypothetical protein
LIHEKAAGAARRGDGADPLDTACLGKSRGVLATTHPPLAQATAALPSLGHPSPEAIAVADGFVLDELYDAFELIRSYAVSGIEAARRGDRDEIKLRLRVQLRDAFRYAVKLHELLSPEQSKGGGS